MKYAETGLHPHDAAQKVGRGDVRQRNEIEVSARADKKSGQGQGCSAIGQRTRSSQRKLASSAACDLLALGIGVREEPANGQEQNRPQFEPEPRGDEQARDLARSEEHTSELQSL